MESPASFLPAGVRLGVSPLSWTNDALHDLGDHIPLETCLAEAAEAGYAGMELGRKFPRKKNDLLAALKPYNLNLVSGWHSGFLSERSVDEEWQDAQPHIELLKDMGCGVMVYGECGSQATGTASLLADSPPFEQINLSEYADQVNAFAKRLEDEGLRFAYHFHLMQLVETRSELESFLQNTEKQVGLVVDTGHAYAAGFHYGEILEQYADRVFHIHLKDVRANVLEKIHRNGETLAQGTREGIFTVPGDGDVDFQDVVRFVNSGHYKGWLVVEAEQDPQLARPFQAVDRARKYLADLFAEQA